MPAPQAAAGQDLELSRFSIVACDEERALEIAAQMPMVDHGVVEARPLLDLPGQAGSQTTTGISRSVLAW